jgi:hypothetical protein
MRRKNPVIGFVSRYATMAGRSCCVGRSWVGLDRSLARHGDDRGAYSCQTPDCAASDAQEDVVMAAGPGREPDDASLITSSLTQR